MINPEDYEKIQADNNGDYVTEREISMIHACFNKEQKDKEDELLKHFDNPDEVNQRRAKIIEIFSYFDPDGSGIINVSELRYILESLGIKEESHVETLINRAEIEGNGYISYRDFAYNVIK